MTLSALGVCRAPSGPAPAAVPDISVVIATCDRIKSLPDTARSALSQEGVDVEVIVIDDSPGYTAARAMTTLRDPRVRYVTNPAPSHGRPAIPRNLGIAQARGALIHFLDDDDLVAPGHYAAARAAFAARPEICVVFGTIEPFGVDAADIAEQQRHFRQARQRALRCGRLGQRWAFTAAMLFGPALLVCSAGIIRRQHAEAIGGFDPALPLVEDVEFYLRAIRKGGVQFLDRPALRYRVGPSLMRQPHRDRLLLESYRHAQARYRREHGRAEFNTLKVLAKGLGLS